jgi:hypothetical protein
MNRTGLMPKQDVESKGVVLFGGRGLAPDDLFYHDVPADQRSTAVAMLLPHAVGAVTSPLP